MRTISCYFCVLTLTYISIFVYLLTLLGSKNAPANTRGPSIPMPNRGFGSSGESGSGPQLGGSGPQLGGLFAGGMPKLKSSSSNKLANGN